MLTVPADASTSLGHRAFYVAASVDGQRVVALTSDGHGSFIDQRSVRVLNVREKPNQIALDSAGRVLAVASDRGLFLLDTSTGEVIARDTGVFQGCHFSAADAHLWVARPRDKHHGVVELRDARTLRINAEETLRDPFGDSAFMLFPNPGPLAVSIWAAAGQDGQCLFWAKADGATVSVDPFDELMEVSPPDFASDGGSFIAVVDASVTRYSYPDGRLLATIPWPHGEEDPIGDGAFFVTREKAIVTSNEGRMYMLDLKRGVILEEVAVSGHTPRPVRELYPSLAHETGLCTDMAFVVSLAGGRFLSIHQRLPSRSNEWQDEIVAWHLSMAGNGS
jgi:hypothetical protein